MEVANADGGHFCLNGNQCGMVAWIFTRNFPSFPVRRLFTFLMPLSLISCSLLKTASKADNLQLLRAVNVTDFVAWNPSLSYNATDPSARVLLPGYRYCIGGPLPTS